MQFHLLATEGVDDPKEIRLERGRQKGERGKSRCRKKEFALIRAEMKPQRGTI
jgi:hypothetical protein